MRNNNIIMVILILCIGLLITGCSSSSSSQNNGKDMIEIEKETLNNEDNCDSEIMRFTGDQHADALVRTRFRSWVDYNIKKIYDVDPELASEASKGIYNNDKLIEIWYKDQYEQCRNSMVK